MRIYQDGFEYAQPAYSSGVKDSRFGSLWHFYTALATGRTMGITAVGHTALSTYSFRMSGVTSGLSYAYSELPTTYEELYLRFYFRRNTQSSSLIFDVISLRNTKDTSRFAIRTTDTDGQLSFHVGASTVGTVNGAYNVSDWHLIEMRVKANATTGVFTVKVDGTTILDWSGNSGTTLVDTLYTGYNTSLRFGDYNLDSIAVNDATGDINNSWIGAGAITSLKPIGAGTYTQMTPNTGANYATVDETPKDDDITYVETDTVGEKDSYDLETLASKGVSANAVVNAVSVNIAGKYTGTQLDIKPILKYSDNEQDGNDIVLGNSYDDKLKQEIFNASPFSAEQWTKAEIDEMEIGIETV